MKTRFKKMLSLVLTMFFVLSTVPFAALTAEAATTYTVGDIIEFGGYPQSRVTDASTVAALNAKVTDGDWQSYGYYSGDGDYGSMTQGDWMRYCDVYLNGQKYRGVNFLQYRTARSFLAPETTPFYQRNNGYETNTNHWFKWESLRWRVIDPSAGLVLSESLIDAQAYSNLIYAANGIYYNNSALTVYACDYVSSSVRTWLNDQFYNAAFTAAEKTKIKKTELNNNAYTGSFNSASTSDFVFLPSYEQMTNTQYGFISSTVSSNTRIASGTEYAKSQGLMISSGKSFWWLRSPGKNSQCAAIVIGNGSITADSEVAVNCYGIRPAFTFKSGIVVSPYSVDCAHENTVFATNGDGTHTKRCAFCDLPLDEPAPHRMGRNMSVSNVGHYTDCPDCGVRFTYAHDDKGSVTTIPGTCVTPGQIKYHCSVPYCSYFGRTEETALNAANHAGPYTDQEAVAATCTMQGSTRGQFCTACNQWKTAPQATDPDLTNHVNTEEFAETGSKCYEAGYTAGVYCNDCETWVSGHEEKPLAEHSWQEIEKVKATCRDAGYIVYACAVKSCGATKREVLERDPDAHDFKVTVYPPTCTDEGYTSHNCTLCRYGYADDIQPALGHAWSAPVWSWNGTTAATATFVCANGDHPETVTATVTSETAQAPTDTQAGKTVYTATAEFEGRTYTDTVEKTVPALNDGLCKWCGERHEGFWGKIIGFFHSVAYFFAHLFGRR